MRGIATAHAGGPRALPGANVVETRWGAAAATIRQARAGGRSREGAAGASRSLPARCGSGACATLRDASLAVRWLAADSSLRESASARGSRSAPVAPAQTRQHATAMLAIHRTTRSYCPATRRPTVISGVLAPRFRWATRASAGPGRLRRTRRAGAGCSAASSGRAGPRCGAARRASAAVGSARARSARVHLAAW